MPWKSIKTSFWGYLGTPPLELTFTDIIVPEFVFVMIIPYYLIFLLYEYIMKIDLNIK